MRDDVLDARGRRRRRRSKELETNDETSTPVPYFFLPLDSTSLPLVDLGTQKEEPCESGGRTEGTVNSRITWVMYRGGTQSAFRKERRVSVSAMSDFYNCGESHQSVPLLASIDTKTQTKIEERVL